MSVIVRSLRRFRGAEGGNVSIEWVLVTAGIVALGIAVLLGVGGGTEALGGAVGNELQQRKPGTGTP